MTLGALGGLGLQLGTAALVGWCTAALLWGDRGGGPSETGVPERALLTIAGFAAFAAALMVLHIATGGAVFGVAGVVPVAAAAVVWRGRAALRPRGARRGPPAVRTAATWAAGAALATALAALYVVPVLVAGSSLKTGDAPWHGGWTEQLLGGEPVPTGPAPVYGANAYPWGFHAVSATLVRLAPGTSSALAADALQIVVAAGVPLAGAVLARRIRADAGWWGAAAAGLVGGFGWVAITTPAFFTSPAEARAGADLVVASPNAVYEMLAPALPRELGLVLLAASGLLVVRALSRGRSARLRAGVAAGLVGLVSVPVFVSACLWSAAAALAAPGRRLRSLGTVGPAALAVFALWAGPALAAAFRYGGFVDVTPELGREWPLPTALGAWGLLLPLAAGGALLAARTRRLEARVVLAWVGAGALLLGAARLRSSLGLGLAGNATLLHQGRVWPVVHLLGAACAGAALAWLAARRGPVGRALGRLAAAAALLVGAVSPFVASRALADLERAGEGGYVYTRPDVAEGSFVRRAAARLGPGDVVDVRGPRGLALLLWQFSGARLARYDDPRLARNDLRIRYADLAARWDARTAGGGFGANFVVSPATGDMPGPVLERGAFAGREFVLVHRPS